MWPTSKLVPHQHIVSVTQAHSVRQSADIRGQRAQTQWRLAMASSVSAALRAPALAARAERIARTLLLPACILGMPVGLPGAADYDRRLFTLRRVLATREPLDNTQLLKIFGRLTLDTSTGHASTDCFLACNDARLPASIGSPDRTPTPEEAYYRFLTRCYRLATNPALAVSFARGSSERSEWPAFDVRITGTLEPGTCYSYHLQHFVSDLFGDAPIPDFSLVRLLPPACRQHALVFCLARTDAPEPRLVAILDGRAAPGSLLACHTVGSEDDCCLCAQLEHAPPPDGAPDAEGREPVEGDPADSATVSGNVPFLVPLVGHTVSWAIASKAHLSSGPPLY
jgi:hypothetical protein